MDLIPFLIGDCMNTIELVIAIIIIAAFGVIGILLCAGKGSFLLGAVRDMEDGSRKTMLTRICGVVLLVITVILAILVF